ncbi:MAG: hypothetical protein KIT18_04270 [Burkholderiales bacterium]|nr:hypothetical protein [Burkholderiales bacterium]
MQGMLFSQMEPPAELEEEFNDWYETEHIPARLALTGFSGAARYIETEGARRYLAVYEIADMEVLKTSGYLRLKTDPSPRTAHMLGAVKGFTRFTCERIFASQGDAAGDFLSVVAFSVPQEERAMLADWYETEHIPLLLQCADWLRVRRYSVLSGDGGAWTDFALHDLRSLDAMDSPERKAARQGPKRDSLAGKPWFQHSGRWLYRLISRHQAGSP